MHLVLQGDARRLPIADGVVQTCVTSPPYYALRDYGVEGQIGLEATPDDYISEMVGVFREVWRILRADGTLWINIADSYNAYNGNRGASPSISGRNEEKHPIHGRGLTTASLKPKDLIGIPWRLALALQADGWWLRSDVIWSKPNPMPESVTDRPTKSHEYLFLLTKSDRYYYDAEAVKETDCGRPAGNVDGFKSRRGTASFHAKSGGVGSDGWNPGTGRNLRSVWTVTPEPFPGSHFATFPRKLVEPCIKAGSSEKGCCPKCRAPWARVVERDRIPTRPGLVSKVYSAPPAHPDSPLQSHAGIVCGNRDPARHCTATRTIGWEPSCRCDAGDPVPCLVFDPFGGAFTTVVVAEALGRHGIATELNREYCEMGHRRLSRPHAPIVRPSQKDDAPMPLFAGVEL